MLRRGPRAAPRARSGMKGDHTMDEKKANSISPENVSNFWEQRSKRTPVGDPMSLVWFETNPERQADRIEHEKNIVLDAIKLEPTFNVLDMGGGYGQWSLRFAPHVNKVVCVELQDAFLERGMEYAASAGIHNINFVKTNVKDFQSKEKFDRIVFAGIIQYLNDADLTTMLQHVDSMLVPGGKVLMLEPSSLLKDRYIINNKFSEALEDNYSAVYRTAEEFKSAFGQIGMKCVSHFDVFPEGSPYNKFPETRLRLYLFER